MITVETAYEQMLSEGFIFAKERRGYFVSDIIVENKCEEKIKLSQVQEKPKEYFLDLKNNGINENNFPFSSWSKIMREVLANKPQGLLTAMPFNGAKVLREAIAKHLYDFRGCVVDSENIVVGAGTEFLYSLIIELLGRDKNFALEDPGYNKIAKIYATNGVPFSYIPLDDDGVCVEELYKTNADIVHITPSHHFPTGIVMPIKRRQELLVWAKEKEGRFVIEDDYDSEFRFVGKPLPTMQSLDEKLVIYINSFTKTLSPSIRISFMVLPPQLMQKFKERLSFYSNTVSSLEQLALAKFIGNGNFESHLNRMKKLYRQQRDKTINAICESGFCDKSDIYEQEAGLHFLLKIKTEKTDDQFRELALQKG
ncbi:MAG: PLP-dependent aminotransferase family protein, partial [Oscillospiraceae bacterium]